MGRGGGRSPAVRGPATLTAVLDAAVDAPARPVGAAVSDPAAYGVYPLIILIVYVIVTGGILCSDLRPISLTTTCYFSALTTAPLHYRDSTGLSYSKVQFCTASYYGNS